jgi:allantoicase
VIDFTELVDLVSERVGGVAMAANDEFFAPKENLLRAAPPTFREGDYTERGKWMDGWETRRRREPGHDWCLIQLGLPGLVHGAIIDTTHFRGNYPESCSIEACDIAGHADVPALRGAPWREILPRSGLSGHAENRFPMSGSPRATHIRLNIFPDGGVARLRVYGTVDPDWAALARQGDVDLAAIEHGGLVIAASDMFFGSRHNLVMPGRATHMGDGWETRRRRALGHEWVVVRLARAGVLRRIHVDTTHFKGNAPGACSLEGCRTAAVALELAVPEGGTWQELLPRTPLLPHTVHRFEEEVQALGPVTHVRLNIFPDGGVSRLRLFGRPEHRGT